MEVNKDIIEEGNKLVHQLTVVRDQFVKNEELLRYSIRKDAIAAKLKDMLKNDTNYDSLKNSIESLISELLNVN